MAREEFEKAVSFILHITNNVADTSIDEIEDYTFSLEQRISELEQRVKELEATKTCDGCKWLDYPNSRHIGGCSKINLCVRLPMNLDYYKPKD